MGRGMDAPARWLLRVMPVIVFVMGCVADAVLNSAVHDPQLGRFLPEICGLTVGALTVLTFAMRRGAYLAAGALFVLVEMATVTLAMPLATRAGICAAALATAAACFAFYSRGPWESPAPAYAREQRERP